MTSTMSASYERCLAHDCRHVLCLRHIRNPHSVLARTTYSREYNFMHTCKDYIRVQEVNKHLDTSHRVLAIPKGTYEYFLGGDIVQQMKKEETRERASYDEHTKNSTQK